MAQVLRGEALLLPVAGPGPVKLEPAEPEHLPSGTYRLKIEADRTLTEQIKAGNYSWGDSGINEDNFPEPPLPAGTLLVETVHFGEMMFTRDVEARLAVRNLRPATLRELLVFGEQYPEIQMSYMVMALGTTLITPTYQRLLPGLYDIVKCRAIRLFEDDPEEQWHTSCRFLAVRT